MNLAHFRFPLVAFAWVASLVLAGCTKTDQKTDGSGTDDQTEHQHQDGDAAHDHDDHEAAPAQKSTPVENAAPAPTPAHDHAATSTPAQDSTASKGYICPMRKEHPKVFEKPGDCPECGMTLEPVGSGN